jgi:predicted dehydrogenase
MISKTNKKIKIGLCGFGKMGKRHYETYKKFDNVIVDAVYDPCIPDRDDLDVFLEKAATLDGVSICSPSDHHLENALSILSINKDIKLLIEKPISNNLFDLKLLEPHKKNILVGHIERFNPVVNRLKSLIADQKPTILNIKTKRLGFFVCEKGSVAEDLLVHDVDIVSYILKQEPKASYLFCNRNKFAFLVSEYKDVVSMSEASWVHPPKERVLEITTHNGLYSANFETQKLKFYDASGFEYDLTSDEFTWPLDIELAHFLDMIEKDAQPKCNIREAYSAIQTILEPQRTK